MQQHRKKQNNTFRQIDNAQNNLKNKIKAQNPIKYYF